MILSNVRLNQYIAALIGVECDSDSYYLNQFSIFVKSEYNIKLTDTNQNNLLDLYNVDFLVNVLSLDKSLWSDSSEFTETFIQFLINAVELPSYVKKDVDEIFLPSQRLQILYQECFALYLNRYFHIIMSGIDHIEYTTLFDEYGKLFLADSLRLFFKLGVIS